MSAAKKYKLPLAAFVVRYFAPGMGLDVTTEFRSARRRRHLRVIDADYRPLLGAQPLTGAGHKIEKIREISQNIEAQIIRVPTGCQDYYPAMYGGVSAIELTEAGIVRKPVNVDLDDVNERIVLAYTGEPRNSGINNWEVMKAHIDGDRAVHRNFDRIAAIASAMRAGAGKARLEGCSAACCGKSGRTAAGTRPASPRR